MFDLFLGFKDVEISSVERDDVREVYEWVKIQKNTIDNNINFDLTFKEFYERFIEYYVSECEFFSKLMIDNTISGIVKGRIEFRNPNEVWFACLLLDTNVIDQKMESEIIKELVRHFHIEYGIKNFFTSMVKKNNSLTLWKSNGFNVIRIASDFYEINGKKQDMFVLGKFI